jgi:DNA topoisomerase-3
MKSVILFEKSSTREASAKVLPPGNVLISMAGHLIAYQYPDEIKTDTLKKVFIGEVPEAPYSQWVYDNLPFLIRQPIYKMGVDQRGNSNKALVDRIGEAIQDADQVIVATDPGREGSLIAWEILQLKGFKGRVLRMRLGAIDEKSIRKAYDDAISEGAAGGDRDFCRYLEGLARQFQDYHSGMNGTRCMGICFPRRKEEPRFSYGEVIIPTLSLLAQLEDEIENFKPETFYKVALDADQGTGAVRLTHRPSPHLKEKSVAEAVAAAARDWTGPLAVDRRARQKGPPSLFSIQKLFKEAGKSFGWKTDKTEGIMQELYDKGYCTYPRTEVDTLFINDAPDAGARVAAIAAQLPDEAGFIETPYIRKGGTYTSEACEHYAYVPTSKPLADSGDVSPDGLKLYHLVAKRYLAHHLPDAIDDVTSVEALVRVPSEERPRSFRASGTIEKSAGWRVIYRRGVDEDMPDEDRKVSKKSDDGEEVEDTNGKLPPLENGKTARAVGASVQSGETTPPKRITSSGLALVCQRLIDWVDDPKLKTALHNDANPNQPKGLGTASSSKLIAPKLVEFAYVEEFSGEDKSGRKKKTKSKDPYLRVTPRGMDIWRWLRQHFPEDATPVSRAATEFELGKIGSLDNRDAAKKAFDAYMAACWDKQRRLVEAFRRVGRASLRGIDGVAIKVATSEEIAAAKAVLADGHPIDVPYGKNDEAKAAGAVWDRAREVFVVPRNAARSSFESFGCTYIDGDVAAYKAAKAAKAASRKNGVPIEVPYDPTGATNSKIKSLGGVWNPDIGTRGSWVVPTHLSVETFEQAGFKRWDPASAKPKASIGKFTPINVPWDEAGANRSKAKALGAMWNPNAGGKGSWVVPEGVPIQPFEEAGFAVWNPGPVSAKNADSDTDRGQRPQSANGNGRSPSSMIAADIVKLTKVTFDNKDEAKKLGARFDRDGRFWYVSKGTDLAPFARARFL